MSYNPFERQMARMLAASPKLKSKLKLFYVWGNRVIFKKTFPFQSSYTIHEIGAPNKESFYGYYDHSPLSKNEEYILFQEAKNKTSIAPVTQSQIEIILAEFKGGKELFRTSSKAYNWQQGSKLMYLEGDRFIYNDMAKGKLISKIVQIKNLKNVLDIPYPIYDAKADFALTLNFDRLTHFRPDYGYRSAGIKVDASAFNDQEDGVFYVDFKTKERHLLISLNSLAQTSGAPFENAEQWVNHIMISPSGTKFMFLHRWLDHGLKKDALYVANIDGSETKCLTNGGMVSHCNWQNETKIIGYLRSKEHGDCYHQIDLSTHQVSKIQIPDHLSFGDGHPSVFQEKMLFDTYPDRHGLKHLMLFDLEKKELQKLGSFYEPLRYYDESRCDLHPRFSRDGNKVFFDSVHIGKRKLCYINLEETQ